MTKQEAGRLGGLATFNKYGRDYMSKIGKKGAAIFYRKYQLRPVGTSDYAVVDIETGKIVNTLKGGLK